MNSDLFINFNSHISNIQGNDHVIILIACSVLSFVYLLKIDSSLVQYIVASFHTLCAT